MRALKHNKIAAPERAAKVLEEGLDSGRGRYARGPLLSRGYVPEPIPRCASSVISFSG